MEILGGRRFHESANRRFEEGHKGHKGNQFNKRICT